MTGFIRPTALSLLFLLAALLLPALQHSALPQEGAVLQELEAQKSRLKSLEKSIEKKRQRARKIKALQRDVLSELSRLDEQISQQWERLNQVKKRWTQTEMELEELKRQIVQEEKALDELKGFIESRLRVLRELGTIGTLNVLLAADSLPELLSRQEYLKLILKYDQQRRAEYLDRLKELDSRKEALAQKQEELKELSVALEQEAIALEERRQEKLAYLDELKAQGIKYRSMISQLERAKKKLKGVIDELTAKAAATGGYRVKELSGEHHDQFSFAAQKGSLNLPLDGTVIVFARRKDVPGIAVEAPWGSEIRAIFDGQVLYSNVLPGYGNVLIMDHGEGYFSLIAQAERFFKEVGQEVAEGEVIGISGGGPWVPEGIYIEIRHSGKQEDPLKWFDLRGMEIIKR